MSEISSKHTESSGSVGSSPQGDTTPYARASQDPVTTDPSISVHLDAVVDYLLRDRDFLISNEIRTKIEELNQLLVLASSQRLKVTVHSTDTMLPDGKVMTALSAEILKRIA